MNILGWIRRGKNHVDITNWEAGKVTSESFNKSRKTYTFNVRVPASLVEEGKTIYFSTKLDLNEALRSTDTDSGGYVL